MALLRQYINGARVHTLNVIAGADDLDALKSLMEGKVEEWETKATGGTSTAMPAVLNRFKFRIGKVKGFSSRESCAFTLHHLDPAKNDDDVRNVVVGKFYASWNTADKAEYCDPISHKQNS